MRRLATALGVFAAVAGLVRSQAGPQAPLRRPGLTPVEVLVGRVTVLADNSFEMQPFRRRGRTLKVQPGPQTKLLRLERGTLRDLVKGYLVVIFGDRAGENVTARTILRSIRVKEGTGTEDYRAALRTAVLARRWFTPPERRPVTLDRVPSVRPVLGRIISEKPLVVETVKTGREPSERVQVKAEGALVVLEVGHRLRDLQPRAVVLVVGGGATTGPLVPRSVLEVPAPGPGSPFAGAIETPRRVPARR